MEEVAHMLCICSFTITSLYGICKSYLLNMPQVSERLQVRVMSQVARLCPRGLSQICRDGLKTLEQRCHDQLRRARGRSWSVLQVGRMREQILFQVCCFRDLRTRISPSFPSAFLYFTVRQVTILLLMNIFSSSVK